MQKIILILISLFALTALATAQTQIVKGQIIDQQSEMPLIGATVELMEIDVAASSNGTTTDVDGYFRLENIPVGRQVFRVSYLGYKTITLPNVLVTAGKEVILNIQLEESIAELNEVVVTAEVEKDRAQNEMAAISARTFSLEEVNRYSGGRNDVARLAGNFAGVSTADDSRNDIVIRGNSPTGLLWRLEGIPIPNPNHFSTLGTTGGPVSALNPNLLSNSDFLTSAFPAEYGNATSGVFDLSFRNGNKDKFEFTGQMGTFTGLELMAEGPLQRAKNSSFVVAYRHSFVSLSDQLGIPVGTNAIPDYRDVAFNINLGNTKVGKFSIFGIGGTSNIAFLGAEIDSTDLFAEADRDAYADSRFGVLGLKHNVIVNQNSYVRTTIAASTSGNTYNEDLLSSDADPFRIVEVDDVTNRYSIHSYFNTKINARFTLRTGIQAELYDLSTDVRDRENRTLDADSDGEIDFIQRRDFADNFTLLQAYAQGRYKLSEKWLLNAGLNTQFFTFNNTTSVEPRAALSYAFAENQKLTVGYGLHSQLQPFPVFFNQEEVSAGVFQPTNNDLDFTKSHHFVLGYDWKFANNWRTKIETYYQSIYDVPVESTASSFSILNAGADFVFPETGSLVNDGTGTNYGVELTVEKFFSQGYYGLLTASIFDSKYTGSDEVERNTAFNNGYVLNVLGGKEFAIGKDGRNALTTDIKFTTAGGRYFTPIDLAASQLAGQEVLQDEQAFSERFDPYFRLDVKFGFRMNSKKRKLAHTWFLDFQNITNRQNVFTNRYNRVTNEINTVYQAGFFPDFMYRIQF